MFAQAQIPVIRVTTQNNQEPEAIQTMTFVCPNGQPPNNMNMCPGGGWPTMNFGVETNYVAVTKFELTDPNNSANSFTRELQSGQQPDSIRVRGNSTAQQNKKPYRLKFDTRQSFFGKPAARSWVLLADYYDNTFSLNATAFELGRRLGLEFTNSFKHVDVYVNGSYKGIYLLTEQLQVNSGRVDIHRRDGWLVEFDYHAPEPHHITFNTAGGNLSMQARIRDPEVDDNFTVNNPLVSFVATEVNALFTAMAAPGFPENGYRDLIDLESFAKYVLIQQLMDNFDFNNKAQSGNPPGSNYAYKDAGKRIHAGPLWDFDLAAGVHPSINFVTHYYTHEEPVRPKHPFYQRLWDDPVFMAKFKKLWDKHKSDFDDMPRFMDSIAYSLRDRVQDNFAAYITPPNNPGGFGHYDVKPANRATYEAEVAKLKDWWTRRMNFFEQEINKLNIDITKDIDQNAGLSTAHAHQVKSGKSLIAVKNGFKMNVSKSASIKITGLNGSVIRTQKFTGGNHAVMLSNLPKGMYMVNVTIDNKKQVLRIPVW